MECGINQAPVCLILTTGVGVGIPFPITLIGAGPPGSLLSQRKGINGCAICSGVGKAGLALRELSTASYPPRNVQQAEKEAERDKKIE